jgi:amidohydrolase
LAPTREHLRSRIAEVAQGVATTLRGQAEVTWLHGSPAVVNDAKMTDRLRAVAREVLGAEKVVDAPQIMGGDDMALWLERAPGSYFFVGSSNPGKETDFPHHHPRFDVDEAALPVAVELLVKGTLDYLR